MLNLKPLPPIQRYRLYDIRVAGLATIVWASVVVILLALLLASANRQPPTPRPAAVPATHSSYTRPSVGYFRGTEPGRIRVQNSPDEPGGGERD